MARYLAAITLVMAALLLCRWQLLRLSEIERQIVGAWTEGSASKPWTLNGNRTAKAEWIPLQLHWRQAGRNWNMDWSREFTWKVHQQELILKERYQPLNSPASFFARIKHRFDSLRHPVVHRIQIVMRTENELVLKKWQEDETYRKIVYLHRSEANGPFPMAEKFRAAASRSRWGHERVGLYGEERHNE